MYLNKNSYYYGDEANQYTFYRLPKALFTNVRFKDLSGDAKILYGLMLDRMGLSMKNGWLDNDRRVYIIFTLEEAMEFMNCNHGKAVKLFAELDNIKGVGLIERVKRGQGKPAIIYVRKFYENTGFETFENEKSETETSKNMKFRLPKNGSQDFSKSDGINNNINKTDLNNSVDDDVVPARDENEKSRKQPAAQLPPEKKSEPDTRQKALPEQPSVPPELAAAARRETERLFAGYTDRQPGKPDIRLVTERVCGVDSAADPPRWTLLPDLLDLLEYAFDTAFAAGVPGNWRYIDGVLDRLSERGIATLAAAHRYDATERRKPDSP